MPTDRQKQITALYHAALEREGRERAAFLGEACAGDDALRREVESLLGYGEAAATFLERPAIEEAALLANGADSGRDLAGRRIGVYQIEARIGAGGMGEVYRARDTKLGRKVAIKVLPSHLMADADRRSRFEREARLLATLNHPHIAQVHGLEESEGLQALVMELVPGETLEAILRDTVPHGTSGRALPLDQALHIARQIADALDAAHEKGIVHRDLKPGNVMIQGAGGARPSRDPTAASRPRAPRQLEGDLVVKVLDFGLAKAVAGDATGLDLTQLPTITSDGNREGGILGTPAYMSPEQARGKPVDKRTDIWAFGCVLYEMLTGRLAFAGETTSDTIAAILERVPDWNALPESTPDTIRHLLQRCLEKDPKRRVRDIGDARAEIDDAVAGRLDAKRTTGAVQATSQPSGWLSPRTRWLVTALIAVIISLAAVPWQWRPSGAARREPGLSRLTHDPGLQTDPALSPDGKYIAYTSSRSGKFDIWVQQLGGGEPRQVTKGPAHDWQPDWSPNSEQLVFRSEREGGGLLVMPWTGGPARRVSSFGYRPRWSADGSQILFLASNAIGPPITPYTVKLDRTPLQPQKVSVADLALLDRQGAWGWNRKGDVTFLATDEAQDFAPRLSTVDLEGGKTVRSAVDADVIRTFKDHQLTIQRAPLAWAPDGTTLYFVGESKRLQNLWAIDIEPKTFAIIGGPRRLPGEASTYPSISADGHRIAFGAATSNPQLWSYALNEAGTEVGGVPQSLTQSETRARSLDLSGDGSKLVFTIDWPGSTRDPQIRVRQMSNSAEQTLDDVDPGAVNFRWSRDGGRLAYRYIKPGSAPAGHRPNVRGLQHLRILDLRTRESRPLTSEVPLYHTPTGWSRDGQFVISIGTRYKEGSSTVALLPVSAAPTAETAVRIIAESTNRQLHQGSMSADGKWVCFQAVDPAGGGSQIAVVASEGGTDWRRVPSPASFDDKPRWSYDGRLLYFVSDRGGMYNVWAVRFDPVAGKLIGEPFQVTPFAGPGEMFEQNIATAEIGVARGRLVMPLVTPIGGIWMLDGIASAPAGGEFGWRWVILLAALAIALSALTKGLSTKTGTAPSK